MCKKKTLNNQTYFNMLFLSQTINLFLFLNKNNQISGQLISLYLLTALHSVREEDDDEEVVTITEEYIPIQQPQPSKQHHFSPREVIIL